MNLAKELPSQKELNAMFDYYPVTGDLVWKRREDRDSQWNGRLAGKVAGNITPEGYVFIKINRSRYSAHRLVWKLAYGSIPNDMMIDHIDGNSGNNKLENLRLATNSQNQKNRVSDIGKRFKGVYKSRKGFKAEISSDEERIYLGVFNCEIEAAKAYDEKALELHGDFAKLNFPELMLVS